MGVDLATNSPRQEYYRLFCGTEERLYPRLFLSYTQALRFERSKEVMETLLHCLYCGQSLLYQGKQNTLNLSSGVMHPNFLAWILLWFNKCFYSIYLYILYTYIDPMGYLGQSTGPPYGKCWTRNFKLMVVIFEVLGKNPSSALGRKWRGYSLPLFIV